MLQKFLTELSRVIHHNLHHYIYIYITSLPRRKPQTSKKKKAFHILIFLTKTSKRCPSLVPETSLKDSALMNTILIPLNRVVSSPQIFCHLLEPELTNPQSYVNTYYLLSIQNIGKFLISKLCWTSILTKPDYVLFLPILCFILKQSMGDVASLSSHLLSLDLPI